MYACFRPSEIATTVFAVLPTFELPDYKKIASEINTREKKELAKIEATQKEIDEVLLQIRRNKAHFDWHQKNKDAKGHDHPEIKDEDLPALTDELAKEAGNFKDLAELTAKVKENIVKEKEHRHTEKVRALMMEALAEKTKMEMPEILIESEIEKSIAQIKDNIARAGGQWEDYLKHTKKTEADFRKDLRESAEKKAQIQLIFNKIAEVEKVELNQEIIEQEIKEILNHYKDASEEGARVYVETILNNQAVLKILENA
jgi:FKBP-type peptidyl-prolyl cis-trans isomerase (trigger factor)